MSTRADFCSLIISSKPNDVNNKLRLKLIFIFNKFYIDIIHVYDKIKLRTKYL